MSTSATATTANDIPSRPHFDFSDTIKSLGQKMKASASAAVTLPGLSNGSIASIVPSGSSRPSQARVSLGLDSALMPSPKYIPKRVAQRSVASEDQFIDEDESMRHDDVGPHLHSERVRNDSADMDIGDDLGVDDQGKRGSGPRSTTDDLDRMVGLEIELCDLID
ncbi:hypothetical protein BG005_010807 [Podila minutissima]|nr:hypothetical protein BG005_010807 [Podila minutissima]